MHRILANGKTEFIGVIVPDLYHHYYSEMLNQILTSYEKFGYKFLVFIGNKSEEIEREDEFVSSVNTDNYMGGYQATSLLARHKCDVLIHINSPTLKCVPSYGRLQGFVDLCEEKQLKNEVYIREMGHSYESTYNVLFSIIEELYTKYNGMKKGIFISNDTHANVFFEYSVPEIRKTT